MRLFSSGISYVVWLLVRREQQPSEVHLNSVSLLQLIASTNPTGPNWLLFSNSSVLMEHLLADIYIPFDCEFLVVREDPKGGVSLFEVYRVNRTAPLQSHLLAVGSQPSSLSWDNRSLYERRNDLLGATIRATSSQVMVLFIILIIIIIIIIIIMNSEVLAAVSVPWPSRYSCSFHRFFGRPVFLLPLCLHFSFPACVHFV